MVTRRTFVAGAAAALAAARAAGAQSIDGWPSRPIRVVFPTGAGGPSENFRLYAEYLKAKFGQPLLLENMPGGSGSIGAMAVARSAPDGHTLMVGSNSITILAPLVIEKHPLNLKQDLVPVAHLFSFRFLLVVNPNLGVKTFKDFVDYAKARPGKLNYGSPGIGTGGHVVTELLLKRTGIDAVHVPYQATTQQLMAAAGGHLDFTFDTPGNARGVVDSGKVIALAVSGKGRAAVMPDVPSFGELGLPVYDGLFVSTSMLAPAGTPQPIVDKLADRIVKILAEPDTAQKFDGFGMIPSSVAKEKLGERIRADYDYYGKLIQKAGIKLE